MVDFWLQQLAEQYQVEQLLRFETWQNPAYLRIHRLLRDGDEPELRENYSQ